MAIDKILINEVLDVLTARGDRGRSLDGLANEVGIRLQRTSMRNDQVENALVFARGRGWVQDRCDEWGEPLWFITTAGSNKQAMM